MTRDELIWRMAEGAWGHHYCPRGANGNFCDQCNADRSSAGEVECFELAGGFKREQNPEWRAAGEGALRALEQSLGIKIADAPTTDAAPRAHVGEAVGGSRAHRSEPREREVKT